MWSNFRYGTDAWRGNLFRPFLEGKTYQHPDFPADSQPARVISEGLVRPLTQVTVEWPDGKFEQVDAWRLLYLVTVDELLQKLDLHQAHQVYQATWLAARPNSRESGRGQAFEDETWRCDPVMGEFEVLVTLPVVELVSSKPEGQIKQWSGYRLYVEWAREGLKPPPITAVRHAEGHLVSLNRRRLLAAQEAGVEEIPAWFSETDTQTGRALWQSDLAFSQDQNREDYRGGV